MLRSCSGLGDTTRPSAALLELLLVRIVLRPSGFLFVDYTSSPREGRLAIAVYHLIEAYCYLFVRRWVPSDAADAIPMPDCPGPAPPIFVVTLPEAPNTRPRHARLVACRIRQVSGLLAR